MDKKMKRRVRDLVRAAGRVIFYIGVPIWLLVVALIVNGGGWWGAFFVYVYVLYFNSWE